MKISKIKVEFKRRKTRQLLLALPMIPCMFIVAFMADNDAQIFESITNFQLLIGATVVIAVGLIFSMINWRCPGCNKYLGKRMNPQYCSSCGVELR